MNAELARKLDKAGALLRSTDGCAVAFSGGVDSSLVLAIAHETLGPRCLAVIATSPTYPARERRAAVAWARERLIPHIVMESNELDLPGFRENPPDRCYHCKRELFTRVAEVARSQGIESVADGTNADDAKDYRPGRRAAEELGVLSPLLEAGMTKDDIRVVAREVYRLPNADKPAMACLASRFPYGSAISAEGLRQVGEIEGFLARQDLRVFRARHHGALLRLELGPEEAARALEPGLRAALVRVAKAHGFTYVTLDLEGYRTGSMNATLNAEPRPCQGAG